MKRGSYRAAIAWVAANDDCYWLAHTGERLMPSVTAALVCDLFEVEMDRVVGDLRRALAKVYPDHEALRHDD